MTKQEININLPKETLELIELISSTSFQKNNDEPLPPWVATPYPDESEWPGGDIGTQYNYCVLFLCNLLV